MYIWLIPFLPEIGNKCMYKIIFVTGIKISYLLLCYKTLSSFVSVRQKFVDIRGVAPKIISTSIQTFFFQCETSQI